MVNQNENENKFIFVLGPYNENGLRFRSSGESYQNEFIFVFVLGYHKDRPKYVWIEDACEGEARGCWAVRPRTSGGCRDGFFLRDFFDKTSRLRYA